MSISFSVGMAIYDKPVGGVLPETAKLRFTVMSLLIHHPLVGEVIIVDNNPQEAAKLALFAAKCGTVKGRPRVKYVAMPEPQGTSPPRNRVFKEASFDHVVCIDSHVLLYPGCLEALAAVYNSFGHGCPDLFHGPMMTEADHVMADHMNDQWRAQMWGTWGRAWQNRNGLLFSVLTRDNQTIEYVSLHELGEQRTIDAVSYGLPENVAFPGHEQRLYAAGCSHPGQPFRIPGHGMGFFACRKDSWLSFHEDARGFGGEEMTTGVRFRQAGRNVWSVPGAKWWHDFTRSYDTQSGEKTPYRLSAWDKVRNYVLELKRLGLDVNVIREHFTAENVNMHDHEWNALLAGANWLPENDPNHTGVRPRPKDMPPDATPLLLPKHGCGKTGESARQLVFRSLEDYYEHQVKTVSDINEDLPNLRRLAETCAPDGTPGRVVELGTRHAVSTTALLAANPKSLTTYDLNESRQARVIAAFAERQGVPFEARVGDSTKVEIPECDLLFVDTDPHTGERVFHELSRHHEKVSRYIVLHDTVIFGEQYGGKPGVLPGVRGFLSRNRQWSSVMHFTTQNGLMVLSKDGRDKRQPPGLLRKALSFARAAYRHANSGFTKTSDEERERRVDICLVCEHRWHDVCGKCGCPVEKKAGWNEETCPDSPPRWSLSVTK